jgi:hypothetical protein
MDSQFIACQGEKMSASRFTSVLLEDLESRQFLSAASSQLQLVGPPLPAAFHAPLDTSVSSLDGNYSGTATVTFDNKDVKIPVIVTISNAGKKVKFKIPIGPFTLKPNFGVTFVKTGSDLGAQIPSKVGSGKIQISKGHMDIDGTLDPGVMDPLPFTFSGQKAAGAAAPSAITVTAATKKNPILGAYKGTMVYTTSSLSIPAAAQFTNNKLGHPTAHVQMEIAGFGELDIDTIIHAHSTGSFDQMLAALPTDGSLSGHITHTGKLSLELFVPHIPFRVTSGSLKRIA